MMEAKETTMVVCILLRHDRWVKGCGYSSLLRFPACPECLFNLYLLTTLSLCALTDTQQWPGGFTEKKLSLKDLISGSELFKQTKKRNKENKLYHVIS